MKNLSSFIKEKYLYYAFLIGIVLKGIDALLEVLGGMLLFIASKDVLTSWVVALTQHELRQDPHDLFDNFILKQVHQLSVSTAHFIALYLLIHGAIKIFLVVNLLKNKLWAYPASITIFFIFIVYQLYRFSITNSYGLIFLSLFDLMVILLTAHEYKRRKKLL